MGVAALLGRVFYSLIFIGSSVGHFQAETIAYASAQGVPSAGVLVPLSGALALLGGLCVALGWKTRMGGMLLVLFLVPVTFMLHDYWNFSDPVQKMNQYQHFMKNISMLGGAFLLAYFGGGPLSLDSRRVRPYAFEKEVPVAQRRRETVGTPL